MRLRSRTSTFALLLSGLLGGCDKNPPASVPPAADGESTAAVGGKTPAGSAPAQTASAADPWAIALDGKHRSDAHKARDSARHPEETLRFFGVTPQSKVVELAPGGGWYTEVLAPLVRDGGQLTVTHADPGGPPQYYGTRQAKVWQERVAREPEVFGKVQTVVTDMDVEVGADGKVSSIRIRSMDLGPDGSADVVLTFRSSHGWYNRDALRRVYAAAYKVLKPGGVFGVVQHRAPEGADPSVSAKSGYLPEATVIAVARDVGFELSGRAEINANPQDTKDYPRGVWTLPPSLTEGEANKDKYLAIGESDRMTLKFVRPAGE